MELQFQKESLPCMRQVLEDIRDQELTQEIRLSEGQPHIGNVVGAWGQVLIRGKQWEDDRIGVSGGVQAWILYSGGETGTLQTVSCWMPFHQDWDLPASSREGKIWIMPELRQMDARGTSERKIMVRANLSLLAKAHASCEVTTYSPTQVPEDVNLKIQTEPMLIPTEMGEKSFVMDEEIAVPQDQPPVEQIVHASLKPHINESKVMAGKLVFRGGADLCVLYENNGTLHKISVDLPFAQYEDLENEFDPDAEVWIYPMLTSFELESGENHTLRLKAGITGQYMVYDYRRQPLVVDAYSTTRRAEIQNDTLELPVVSDYKYWEMDVDWSWNQEGEPIEVTFYSDHPREERDGSQLSGRFQVLWKDAEGMVHTSSHKWEQLLPENGVYICGVMDISAHGARVRICRAKEVAEGIEIMSGLRLSEAIQKDPNRPSLILRRMSTDSLWDLAKRSGSTVASIMQANGLETDPQTGDMIMIPIP